MTKDPKDAHLSDSASSGNVYEAATETRRAKDWLDDYTEHLRIRDGHHKWEIAKALASYAQSESKGLASRVEELESNKKPPVLSEGLMGATQVPQSCPDYITRLEELLFDAQYFVKYARQRMLDAGQSGDMAHADGWLKRVEKVKAERALAQPSGNTPGKEK